MKASTKLAAYVAGLAVVFGVAFGIAGAVIPSSVVENWQDQSVSEHSSTTPEPTTDMTGTSH